MKKPRQELHATSERSFVSEKFGQALQLNHELLYEHVTNAKNNHLLLHKYICISVIKMIENGLIA